MNTEHPLLVKKCKSQKFDLTDKNYQTAILKGVKSSHVSTGGR